MIRNNVIVNGKKCVTIEASELRRLERLARQAEPPLPSLPQADAKGNRPAADYLRVSVARDIIRERRALGLTQAQLADLAGLRQETISRVESGKHSPTVRTVEAIDQALKRYAKRKRTPIRPA